MTAWVRRIFPYLLLAPTALPLVVYNGVYFPYLFPKVVLFYALALLSLAAFAYLATRGEAFYFARLKSRLTWIPAALLALAYATSLVGTNFYKSFWSIFGRGDGLLMLTLSVASFYLILVTCDRLFFERFVRAVAVVGTAVALWGVVEWLFLGGRIGGSIGNAAFLAGYLALTFFITLIATREAPAKWVPYLYGAGALQLVAIVLTATRGTVLAFLVAGVVALIYGLFKGGKAVRQWSAGAVAVLFLISISFFIFRDTLSHSSIAPVARLAQISTADPDIANRLFVWEHLLTEVGKRPLLGYGAEHIALLFDRFYDPSKINEEWFDRSHNAYLDYAAQFGIGGVALYLALIAFLVGVAFQYRKRDVYGGNVIILAALVYAVQNFFVFDTISSWWLFLALLAVACAQTIDVPRTTLSLSRAPSIGAVLAGVLVLLILPVSILPAIANYDLTRGYFYHVVDVQKAKAYFENGLALHTYGELEYGYQLHTLYTDDVSLIQSEDDRRALYELARDVLMKNFARFSYDARTAVYLAHVLDSAPKGVAVDRAFERTVITKAISLSPKRAQSWYVLANISIGEAKDLPSGAQKNALYTSAIETMRAYIALVPKLSEPHFILAELYGALGDTKNASQEAELGRTYYAPNLLTARRAVLYYEKTLDLPNAKFFLEELLRFDPTNGAARSDLEMIQAHEQQK